MNDQPQKRSKPKAPRPVESFGPEILAALLRGATEMVQLPISYKLSIRLRLRIHQLREAMRKAAHPQYHLVARVRVTIQWPPDTKTVKQGRHNIPEDRNTKCLVTLQPNDAEFADLHREAGVDPQLGSEPITEDHQVLPPSALEDILKNFGDN